MKKIYEDGGERQPIEEISSGAFDFSNTEPLPARQTKPSPIRTGRPADPSPQTQETVQLTKAQLDELVQQVLAAKEQSAPANAPHRVWQP